MNRALSRSLPALSAVWLLLSPPSGAFAIPASDARSISFKLQSEGMRLYKEGKYRDAIQAFRQVVNLNLNSFMAHYYLGICLNADRRYGEAIEPLKIALDLQPDYVQAHLALGDAYLKGGDATEARAEYLRALDLQPNYAPALDGLGRLFESTGQDDQAEQQYRRALEINVAFADAYTHLGDLYLRKGRLADATELFLKAIAVKPDFSSAYTRLGRAYAGQRLQDDAIAATRKSQLLAPEDPEPHVALARIYLDLGSQGRAEAEIQAAMAKDHDHPGAHLILAELKRAQEDFDGAVEVLQGLHERGVEDALMRRTVDETLAKAQAAAARHAALKKAAEGPSPAPGDFATLGRFLAGQGAHRRSAELLQRASDLMTASVPPDPSAALLRFEAGNELLAAHLRPQAIALFESLAEVATPPAGTPAAEPADAIGPALRGAALFNLGVARASLQLDAQAIEAFSAYLSDHPGDARAHLYLGNAYYRLGRMDEARASFAFFLERAGTSPEAARVERLLRGLDRGQRPSGPRPGSGTEARPAAEGAR